MKKFGILFVILVLPLNLQCQESDEYLIGSDDVLKITIIGRQDLPDRTGPAHRQNAFLLYIELRSDSDWKKNSPDRLQKMDPVQNFRKTAAHPIH